jgi:glutathione S-transferase
MSVSGQPLILYGAHISTCTKRVETVLRYHNLKYEFQHVDYTVLEHKGPAFLKLQPVRRKRKKKSVLAPVIKC